MGPVHPDQRRRPRRHQQPGARLPVLQLEQGRRDVIAWYRERDTSIPRIVWGKYPKLQYDRYESEGLLEEPLPDDERDKWSGLDVDRPGEFG